MLLKDQVAIVTGAAQGIGRACAERLAREGAKVVLADLNEAEGQRAAKDVGSGAHFVSCNVSKVSDVDGVVAAAVKSFGRVDVLVNNAGVLDDAPFLDLKVEEFDRVLGTNLRGAFLLGQAVARQMVKQPRRANATQAGAIVNMSSVNGRVTIPTIASYNASKGAVDQLTRVMALSLADKGVRVNAVAPGTIATELAAKAVLTSDEARARIMSRTPMKRLGTPAEIADTVAYLASDAASYVTGEIVVVDGGRMTLNYTVNP